jgi:PEP-CTERM motif
VQWSIGSLAFTGDLGSGTAELSSALQYANSFHYNIYESAFQISLSLSPGTYWLTLQNATTPGGDPVFWDQTGGSSLAYDSAQGAIPSESFQIFGSAVPEPGSLTLFAMGAVCLIGCVRLRRKSMTAYASGPKP